MHEELYEQVRKRPGMFFGSSALRGLHFAIIDLILYCIDKDKKSISITINGADIIIKHEGEMLEASYCTDIVKAACKTFVYENNKFQLCFDNSVFDTSEPNIDALFDRLRELAFLNKHLSITLNKYTFFYENGLNDFFDYLQDKAGRYWISKHAPVGFHAEDEGVEFDVLFASVCSSFESSIISYANNHRTEDNGVHVDGFVRGLKSVLTGYKPHMCEHMTSLKDVDIGLIMHVKALNLQYSGATKESLQIVKSINSF